MIKLIHVPKHSANDVSMIVVALRVTDGEAVHRGSPLLDMEGAKAVVELESPVAGEVHLLVAEGDQRAVGAPVAVIVPLGTGREAALATMEASVVAPDASATPETTVEGARFSRAAYELMERHGLEAELFAGRGLITAAMVADMLPDTCAGTVRDDLLPVSRQGSGRVLLMGAGPGAYQLLSVLLHEAGTEVVGLLDDDPAKQSLSINGVRVLGPLDELLELAAKGAVDGIVCTSPTAISFRRKVADLAVRAGVRQANVIHPSALFDDGVLIGQGNFFGALCFLGAETRIGDYGFYSSRTTFEHHNRIGNGVTTGPNVATSGNVAVGNHVKFGTGVVVEPNLTIGDEAVIASGSVVVSAVATGAVLKARVK